MRERAKVPALSVWRLCLPYLLAAICFLALFGYFTTELFGCIFWIVISILLVIGALILT